MPSQIAFIVLGNKDSIMKNRMSHYSTNNANPHARGLVLGLEAVSLILVVYFVVTLGIGALAIMFPPIVFLLIYILSFVNLLFIIQPELTIAGVIASCLLVVASAVSFWIPALETERWRTLAISALLGLFSVPLLIIHMDEPKSFYVPTINASEALTLVRDCKVSSVLRDATSDISMQLPQLASYSKPQGERYVLLTLKSAADAKHSKFAIADDGTWWDIAKASLAQPQTCQASVRDVYGYTLPYRYMSVAQATSDLSRCSVKTIVGEPLDEIFSAYRAHGLIEGVPSAIIGVGGDGIVVGSKAVLSNLAPAIRQSGTSCEYVSGTYGGSYTTENFFLSQGRKIVIDKL